jgi:outer membrane protein OmpA-like peptidoglycan-associated protein
MMKNLLTDFKLGFTNTTSTCKKYGSVALVAVLVSACASSPKMPEGAAEVRHKLSALQADPQLSSLAPVAMKDAEAAVREAEKPTRDKALSQHLVFVADRKVDTAHALAQDAYLENQRKNIAEQRDASRLNARTAEADAARQQVESLQRQIQELNAKTTERGLVVTLGDVLFETGRAEIKGNGAANLAKLAAFLNQYPERSVVIEGHTDNVGNEDYNMGLSQRRADTVKAYLLSQGIAADRVVAVGKGEDYPVASNDTATGRQMNRRVEVIISNPATAK